MQISEELGANQSADANVVHVLPTSLYEEPAFDSVPRATEASRTDETSSAEAAKKNDVPAGMYSHNVCLISSVPIMLRIIFISGSALLHGQQAPGAQRGPTSICRIVSLSETRSCK